MGNLAWGLVIHISRPGDSTMAAAVTPMSQVKPKILGAPLPKKNIGAHLVEVRSLCNNARASVKSHAIFLTVALRRPVEGPGLRCR